VIIERVKDSVARRMNGLWAPAVFAFRTARAKDGYVCRNVLGSRMYLDVSDPGICRDLITRGIREDWGTRVVQTLIKPGQTVVDIGANIGYYVLLECRLVGPHGRVYAIEPVPRNYELLRRNVEANRYPNVGTFQLAVGADDGTAEMHLSHLRNWHSMLASHGTGQTIQVKQVSLDSFLRDKAAPALVRMDVEGYEYEIILGMSQTLARATELTLYIEVHPHIMGRERTRRFLLALSEQGYEIARIANRSGELHWRIETFLADDDALSGRKGGYLAFFHRVRGDARR